MNFKLVRHLRLATLVGQIAGVLLHDNMLFWIATIAFIWSYQWSIHKIEKAFERADDAKIETEDN